MSRELDDRISELRAELAGTLDAIEEKFDVPKQTRRAVERGKAAYRRNPVPWWIGGAAAGIVIAGLIAWAIFSDDD